jgi:hypothetical protein
MDITVKTVGDLNGFCDRPFVLAGEINRDEDVIEFIGHKQ